MIAVLARERAATGSRLENVGAAAPATGNTVVGVIAIPVASDATAERQAMIAEAAYYIAERRGFDPGHELEDWLRAEREMSSK
jgi:hypothetical protein